jgi:hypothetical protein
MIREPRPAQCSAKENLMLRIDIPSLAEFKALTAAKGNICVSIYVPTFPLHDQAHANRIAFKDLAKEALSQLEDAGTEKRRIEPLKEQFRHLGGAIQESADDNKYRYRKHDPSEEIDEFWRAQANGLAVLATPDNLRMFRLADRPQPLSQVADRFHLTPIIRAMTSPHHIFVLALSEDAARLVHVFVNLPPGSAQECGTGNEAP